MGDYSATPQVTSETGGPFSWYNISTNPIAWSRALQVYWLEVWREDLQNGWPWRAPESTIALPKSCRISTAIIDDLTPLNLSCRRSKGSESCGHQADTEVSDIRLLVQDFTNNALVKHSFTSRRQTHWETPKRCRSTKPTDAAVLYSAVRGKHFGRHFQSLLR